MFRFLQTTPITICCLAALFTALVLQTKSPAAVAGAWEDFATEAHADAWNVYDYARDDVFAPEWFGADGNGDIFLFHEGDEGLWFFTDLFDYAGGGALVGDYAEQDIQAIQADVFIGSLDALDFIDYAIFADGPAGERYYYSDVFLDEDFDGGGWWSLRFGFDEDWFYFDGDAFVAVEVTPEMLASIEEIGFRFFLKPGVTESVYSALDNVRLEPLVAAPELATTIESGEFRLSFTPPTGNFCAVERMNPETPEDWAEVTGQSFITGESLHTFATPLSGGSELFRVSSYANYVPLTP